MRLVAERRYAATLARKRTKPIEAAAVAQMTLLSPIELTDWCGEIATMMFFVQDRIPQCVLSANNLKILQTPT